MLCSLPDFAYLSSVMAYEPETGVLIWRCRPLEHFANAQVWKMWNTRFPGTEAGTVERRSRTSYLYVKIDGRKHLAHRVSYLLYTGTWPKGQIDHIDGNGLNNLADNLRDVTTQTNQRNARMYGHNTSGVNGVAWHKPSRKWRAVVRVDGRLQHLGLFDTIEEATSARLTANEKYGFSERHGYDETRI